jgi:hypothetical protein
MAPAFHGTVSCSAVAIPMSRKLTRDVAGQIAAELANLAMDEPHAS